MCSASIPETYKTDVSPDDAVDDLSTMLELRESGTEYAVRLVEHPERWTLVIYRLGTPITLSDVLPQLQHMGLEVVDEHPYKFTGTGDNQSRSGSTNSVCGPRPTRPRAACGRSSRPR